jgi:hypothetical protein
VYPTYWHLAAYSASLTNNSTLTPVAALVDQVLTRTTANNYILPQPGRLMGIYSAGVSITDAQINTPSLRYVGLPFVAFLNAALTIPSPPALTWWGDMGPPIPKVDEIQMLHSLGGAAPEQEFDLLWFKFATVPPAAGPIYRLKFTATITAVANAWTTGAISPFSTLPQGIYDVVGMDCVGANLVAARLIFPGSFFRPGCLGRQSASSIPSYLFTAGNLGTWGTFASVNLPNLEILATGANTAQTLFLDLIRRGDYPGPGGNLALGA